MMNITDFNRPVELFISKKKYEKKLMDFSYNVSKTTDYSDCGQTNFNLKVYQHFIGKLIELGVYLHLSGEGIEVTEPDFNIYKGSKKSWDSDLKVNDSIQISIKGQDVSSANRFGLSWTFQDISNGRKDKMLDSNKLIIPGLYDNIQIIQKNYLDYYYIIVFPPLEMDKIIWGDPKKKSLIGTKRILYAKDNYPLLDKWVEFFGIPLEKEINAVWKNVKGDLVKSYTIV